MSQRTKLKAADAARTQVVLGAPIFGSDPNFALQMPLGQIGLAESFGSRPSDPQELYRLLAQEYAAIAVGLLQTDVNFKIALSHRDLLAPGVLESIVTHGVSTINFPEIESQVSAYPRDFVTWIPEKRLLLVPPYLRPRVKGISIVRSSYAIGGRILYRQGVVLVNELLDTLEDIPDDDAAGFSLACQQTCANGVYTLATAPVQPLRQAGLRVGLLPNGVVRSVLPDHSVAHTPDDHPDRFCGLLEDKQGQLHLIVDPQIYSGVDNVFLPPNFGPRETLRRYQEVCEELGIMLHVPAQLTIPASICFWQAPNLKVLMTSGDAEVASIVASIVGEDNLVTTEIPIIYQPICCKAGIRCLIGEIPTWLL